MHDNYDVQPFDLESLTEIAAMADLMIAAADARTDRLSREVIDHVLHVRDSLESGREIQACRSLPGPRGSEGHQPRGHSA